MKNFVYPNTWTDQEKAHATKLDRALTLIAEDIEDLTLHGQKLTNEFNKLVINARQRQKAQRDTSPYGRPRPKSTTYDLDRYVPDRSRDKRLRSSWNDILHATFEPILGPGEDGWMPINSEPPRTFPTLAQLTGFSRAQLDIAFLRTLPEFHHWNDAEYGDQMKDEDIKMMKYGKRSLLYFFLRGPVPPHWYHWLCNTDNFYDPKLYVEARLLGSDRYEQYWKEVKQVKDDFAEFARVEAYHGNRRHVLAYHLMNGAPAMETVPRVASEQSPRGRRRYTYGRGIDQEDRGYSTSDMDSRPALRRTRERSPSVSRCRSQWGSGKGKEPVKDF